MITNFYTLQALAKEWNQDLNGYILGDAYSQTKDEITLAFASKERTYMVRVRIRQPLQYVFRVEGYNKARRNVATLFQPALDQRITHIKVAERDRMFYIEFEQGTYLQMMLFGNSANVLYVNPEGIIIDAFQQRDRLMGQTAPAHRPAPSLDLFEQFNERWKTDKKSIAKAISSAYPLFNNNLAKEVIHRSGITASLPAECSENELVLLFEQCKNIDAELQNPSPRIYWDGDRVAAFSTITLHEFTECKEEQFDTIDECLRVFIRRRLGQSHFDAAYKPLEKALRTARDQNRNRLDAMLNALSEESRADKYENWGHLLMAAQKSIPPNVDRVEVDDLFNENTQVAIPLDPTLTGIENAEKYYDKARRTRAARAHAEERLEGIEALAEHADQLLHKLNQIKTASDIKKFEKAHADQLAPFLGQQNSRSQDQIPFRRYDLGQGYEVWVGRNAKQNDLLTFKHARKFDLWMHARGVPGSHAVLRRTGRTVIPPKNILEQAASITAFHSKARGSSLVPVIIVERKHVRKPRGAAAGAVLVEKEEVLLVEPGLPQ
ncbi:MAG: DUF814 domain-containing protein [Rhodothermaceae bacterium]|nr:DUF814 domain-containing protein [Rhodothermaceae bacterium]